MPDHVVLNRQGIAQYRPCRAFMNTYKDPFNGLIPIILSFNLRSYNIQCLQPYRIFQDRTDGKIKPCRISRVNHEKKPLYTVENLPSEGGVSCVLALVRAELASVVSSV